MQLLVCVSAFSTLFLCLIVIRITARLGAIGIFAMDLCKVVHQLLLLFLLLLLLHELLAILPLLILLILGGLIVV